MRKTAQKKKTTAKGLKTAKKSATKAAGKGRKALKTASTKKPTGSKNVISMKAHKARKNAAKRPTPPRSKTHKTNVKKSKPTGTNVIWKFLEMKEARRQQTAEARQNSPWFANQDKDRALDRQAGHGRFNGPRRRAS